MFIAIISDTHDHLTNLTKALDIIVSREIDYLLHAGDFTSPFTSRVLKNFSGEFHGIFGNNDGDRILLRRMFNDRIHVQPFRSIAGDRKIVMVHEPDSVEAFARSGMFDLVVYGHTHEAVVKTTGTTLVVNPGEICGWLYGKPSFAVINLDDMSAEIVPLQKLE